ncbi:hypothetical protein F5Y11DRAFT_362251 [Daldinia sp. FL1419]|nr:hypothetical protein F5Y11DRAFT_362251 [Daldinia sp. FL1419]
MSPYPSTPRLSRGMLQQRIITDTSSISSMIQEIANSSPLDEICNAPGSVRWHICRQNNRDPASNTVRMPMLFFIYQTTRHGPQNGFRLCLVHEGYYLGSEDQSDMDQDDVDILEKPIPYGHKELAILGVPPRIRSPNQSDENSEMDLSSSPSHDTKNDDDAPIANIDWRVLPNMPLSSEHDAPVQGTTQSNDSCLGAQASNTEEDAPSTGLNGSRNR